MANRTIEPRPIGTDCIKLCHWNVCGWNAGDKLGKEKVIKYLDCAILTFNETHLKDEENVSLPGYTWFGQNRSQLQVRARKASGGVGILVRNSLFKTYNGNIIDKGESIMDLKFEKINFQVIFS